MLTAIGQRELPIPDHIDIFHLTEEYPATDKSALEAVTEVRNWKFFTLIGKYNNKLLELVSVTLSYTRNQSRSHTWVFVFGY